MTTVASLQEFGGSQREFLSPMNQSFRRGPAKLARTTLYAAFLFSGLTLALLAVVPTAAFAQSIGGFTTLRDFSAFGDGFTPQSGLTLGSDGNFYGTTYYGGTIGTGTIFVVTPDGVQTTLHSFGTGEGANPTGSLIQAKDGNFYGTTSQTDDDDDNGTGGGTVFSITQLGC